MKKPAPANMYRWQLRAHEALGRMVAHGVKHDFPPLMWTLASTGALTGEAIGLASTPDEQRAALEQWATYLKATVKERTDRDGVVHLYAPFKWGKGEWDAGALRATIYPPLEDEDGESS
ncbi:hypothetical protein [Streptomyces sp. NBC_01716]|uniref:hypothetical protein n=1 Tax=Streptomyces sp. NBC_01716 TaxID=2975917 RepID=UPI002E3261B3|nr:hypothetical protein [Streptomyces sp. NBC_01716]